MKRFALVSAALGLTFAAPATAGIDLVGDFNVNTGTVTVKNIGDAAASISVVTIECKRRRPPVRGNGGGCPEIPPAAAAPYVLPAFPNKVAVQVTPLAPGASFNHPLAFFPALVFPPGDYAFTVRTDDGNSVPESNEGNNIIVRTKVVP